jgi:hypothetical protein
MIANVCDFLPLCANCILSHVSIFLCTNCRTIECQNIFSKILQTCKIDCEIAIAAALELAPVVIQIIFFVLVSLLNWPNLSLQAESIDAPRYIPANSKVDKMHFKECLIEMFQVRAKT